MKPFEIFAVVQPGLEEAAADELTALGIKNLKTEKGGITFAGHQTMLFKVNNYSRICSRFIIRLARFKAFEFWKLEKEIAKIDFKPFLGTQKPVFRVTSNASKLYHEGAIEERFVKACPQPSNTGKEQLFIVNVLKDQFTVSVDSSGEHLHKRGYMEHRTEAPLRETTAAAMLFSIGKTDKLIDPMCGSGTIPIEFAVNSSNLPSCRFRTFAFENWPSFLQDRYEIYKEEAGRNISEFNGTISAYDVSEKALEAARHNAEQAGVSDCIDFKNEDVLAISNLDQETVLVTNPPYGKRLAVDNDIYGKLNELVLHSQGSSGCYLIPSKDKDRNLRELFSFDNGGIKVSCVKIER